MEAKLIGLPEEVWGKYGKLGYKVAIADPIDAIIKGVDPETVRNRFV